MSRVPNAVRYYGGPILSTRSSLRSRKVKSNQYNEASRQARWRDNSRFSESEHTSEDESLVSFHFLLGDDFEGDVDGAFGVERARGRWCPGCMQDFTKRPFSELRVEFIAVGD